MGYEKMERSAWKRYLCPTGGVIFSELRVKRFAATMICWEQNPGSQNHCKNLKVENACLK